MFIHSEKAAKIWKNNISQLFDSLIINVKWIFGKLIKKNCNIFKFAKTFYNPLHWVTWAIMWNIPTKKTNSTTGIVSVRGGSSSCKWRTTTVWIFIHIFTAFSECMNFIMVPFRVVSDLYLPVLIMLQNRFGLGPKITFHNWFLLFGMSPKSFGSA